MKPPGVIVNARARRAGGDPRLREELLRLLPDEYVQATRDLPELELALRRLRALGVEQLVLVGGDGTVGGTLTPLVRIFGAAALPAISLVAGGTVNTIARSLGADSSAPRIVHKILDGAPPRLDSVRPLLLATPESGEPRAGLIFANGVGARWLELYYQRPTLGPGAAAALVGRIAGSALLGTRLARRLFEPRPIAIEVDGLPLDASRFTVAGAASVRDLGLGFRPFHTAGSDPERFHFLYTAASAARVCAELPALRLGLHGPSSCLHHFTVRDVALRFPEPEPWSIDADLYPATTALRLSAGAQIRFVSY